METSVKMSEKPNSKTDKVISKDAKGRKTRMRRFHSKSRNGCYSCKKLKIKVCVICERMYSNRTGISKKQGKLTIENFFLFYYFFFFELMNSAMNKNQFVIIV